MTYNISMHFASSLAANGSVTWRNINARPRFCSTSATVTVGFRFPEIDWTFLTSVYGWPALQYQAWSRGHILVPSHSQQTVLLHSCGLLEFWVDDVHHFGGDFYCFRNAPLVLHLSPGVHQIDVRLIRDVRSAGADLDASLPITLDLSRVDQLVATEDVLISDLVNSRLASHYASVRLLNPFHAVILITAVRSRNVWFMISAVQYNS